MEPLDLIKQPIEQELLLFRKNFQESLQTSDPYLSHVFSAITQTNGKLMRPILLLLVAKEFGEVTPNAYFSAVTLELLHIASLVHDDIVDESSERRGRPSLNALHGNQVAVLVGDYLLSTSLTKACDTMNVEIVRRIALLGKRLSSGEILQLKKASQDNLSEESYFDIIRLKTATLFSMSAELGAVSAGVSDERLQKMNLLGNIIGTCFQIRDDIFDYFEDPHVGKPTGNDIAEGKITLPLIHALNHKADSRILSLVSKAKTSTISKDEIAQIIDFAKVNGGIDYATQRMNAFAAEAKKLISDFRLPEIRQALLSYVDFVTARTL